MHTVHFPLQLKHAAYLLQFIYSLFGRTYLIVGKNEEKKNIRKYAHEFWVFICFAF